METTQRLTFKQQRDDSFISSRIRPEDPSRDKDFHFARRQAGKVEEVEPDSFLPGESEEWRADVLSN